ncbi:MAG TPA: hypothetical protein VKE96_34915 [Vicinamibacterales bacterium]|nr:hypothetical protein [Vicinamibacterales bacterium]
MLRTALKLALVAIVANATWHLFVVYSAQYKFKDAVQYAAESRGKKTDEQLKQEVFGLAMQAELPVDEETVKVQRLDPTHTIVETSYTRTVELFPGLTYPWPFTVHVDAYTKVLPDTK